MFKLKRNTVIILIIVGLILVGLIGYMYKYFIIDTKHIDKVFQKGNSPKVQNTKSSEINYPFDNNSINLLIVGLDKASNRSDYDLHRTDTILFVNINFKDKKVRGISVPRDTLTEIYNVNKWDKINSAYGYGGGSKKDGFFYTMETVSQLLGGMPIYYYVGFDLDAIRKVVNILGGVYVNVEVPVKVKTQWINIDLKPGYQKLNGIQTLYYALWRKTPGGDIDRIKRDKELILTVFQQLKESNKIIKLPEIYWKIRRHFYTNLSLQQITSLALFAQNMKKENIVLENLPGDYYNYMGISYWKPNYDEIKKLVKSLLNYDIEISLQMPEKYKYSYSIKPINRKSLGSINSKLNEIKDTSGKDKSTSEKKNSELGNNAAMNPQTKNKNDQNNLTTNDLHNNDNAQNASIAQKVDTQKNQNTQQNGQNSNASNNGNLEQNGNVSNKNTPTHDNSASSSTTGSDQSISTNSDVYNNQ